MDDKSKKELIESYLDGESLGSLAKEFGISRQRVHQLVQLAGVWREHTAVLKTRDTADYLEQYRESCDEMRGQRYSWVEIYTILTEEDGLSIARTQFNTWRKAQVWPTDAGMGPEIRCSRCFEIKSRDLYANYEKGPGKKESICKKCHKDYVRSRKIIDK